jgi:AcrR family transcriptional regulator
MKDLKTKERIIRNAKKLFAKNGFDGTSMKLIADSVKINKSSLYYFFKNKEDIYITIVSEVIDDVIEVFSDTKESLDKKLLKLFKISASSGPVIFSTGKMTRCGCEKLKDKFELLYNSMIEFLKDKKLRISTEDALHIILDVTQKYARNIAEKRETLEVEHYSKLLTKLLKK